MNKLIDNYGRTIDYLRISVTDRCNLRCIYCMPEQGIDCKASEQILTYEEIVSIVRAAASLGISKIRITGGEPLVRSNILYLLDSINRIPGINDVSLTTNGVLLNKYAEGLKNIGLKRINVSLDSLMAAKYGFITKKYILNEVLCGIDKALSAGFNPVKINVVVMNGINDDEVTDFARLTYNRELHVRFIEYMPIGNCLSNSGERFISNDEVMKICENAGKLRKEEANNTGVSASYRYKGAKGTVSFISPLSRQFCSSCSRLRLTSDGKLKFCLCLPGELDLMPLVRSGEHSIDGLRRAFILAAAEKPMGHCLNDNSSIPVQRTMSQIGG